MVASLCKLDDTSECFQVGEEGGVGGGASQTIWMPMEYEAQPQWRWLDWARFYFYRFVAPPALQTLDVNLKAMVV